MRVALATTAFVLTAVGFSACDMNSSGGEGRLTVYLTDMPFPFDDAAEANVTIQRVELVSADSAETIVLTDSSMSFNLLELQNGATATLASLEIPDGNYAQLRVIVDDDASVMMKDSTLFDLKVPSGSQTGIKINLPEFDFSGADDDAEIIVDFNVEESFVVRGNPATVAEITGFIFKPVLQIESFELNGSPQEINSTDETEG